MPEDVRPPAVGSRGRVEGVAAAAVLGGAVLIAVYVGSQVEPAAPAPPHEGMRWIAGGESWMGSDDPGTPDNERPTRRVRVNGFWIAEHPVTNAQFAAFVAETGYITTAERQPEWEEIRAQLPPGTPKPPDDVLVPGSLIFVAPDSPVPLDRQELWWRWTPGAHWRRPEGPASSLTGRDNHPVVHVSWDDAVAYAAWAGKRLPTEAEWEYAARGGLDRKRFVWGDEFRPHGVHMANTFQGAFPHHGVAGDGFPRTSPVKSFAPNGYGLFDMAGNVWQWTSDAYRSGPESPDRGQRVIKGGSFLCHDSYCESYRPSARRGAPTDTGASHIGLRVAASE